MELGIVSTKDLRNLTDVTLLRSLVELRPLSHNFW